MTAAPEAPAETLPGSSWQTARPEPLFILAPPDRLRSLAVEEIRPRARTAAVWVSEPQIHGSSGVVHLTPEQLDQVADDLRARAALIRANLR